MIANRNFEHCEPLTWVGRMPVYLSTLLAGVQAVGMILTALAQGAGGYLVASNHLLSPLVFSFPTVAQDGSVWRFVTYAFVNPPEILFVIQLFMFAWFGRDVEKFLGRRSFAWLCAILLVAMPAMLTVLSLLGINQLYYGSSALNFAVFLAFVLIYPRAEIFFGIEARWIAAVFMAFNSLQCVALSAWPQLIMLWWGLAVVALWLGYEGVGALQFSSIGQFLRCRHSERKLSVVRREAGADEPEVYDSIDPILEKIARQGMASLTRSERERLERARTALLEKERRD